MSTRPNLNGTSHFIIEPAGQSWSIAVYRLPRLASETIPATSLPEAMRLARPLSDSGLVGYVRETP